MEFRLLGPVEVIADGEPIALGGRQRRTLLSILVVHRDQVVSTDRFIEELWGEDAPRTARKTVQAHVAHLRRALNRDREILAGSNGGYLLVVDDDDVDSHRFEALLEEARGVREGDPSVSAETLGRALELFRGPPLAEVADDAYSLRVEASRLEELRLAAEEELLDARLAAGDAAGVATEAERLVAEHPLRERLWALLMLGLYRWGRQSEALRAYSRLRQILADQLGIEPSSELQRLEQRILEQEATLDESSAPAAPPVAPPRVARNPYKGLRAFDEADAPDFFGREELVRRLVERLERRDPAGPLVVLAGPSGAGKSSAVRAGVVPELRERGHEVATMFPGRDPLTTLARTVGEVTGLPPEQALEVFTSPDLRAGLGLVVVVDQLEELFTMADPDDADRLLDLMAEAIGAESGSIGWVTTVRADFLDRLMLHPRLGPLLQDALVLVPPLEDHEVMVAVANPARRVGVSIEPELPAEVLRDVAARPATLPLLQYALTDLFDRRRADTITVRDYRLAGGLSGALARRADEAYTQLQSVEQTAMRQLLLRLIAITEEGEEVRRRLNREQLIGLPFDEASLEAVIERLGRQRLLVFDQDPGSGRSTIEIAHEALITEWPRLNRWVDEARSDLRTRQRLAAAVTEWEEADRETSFLMRAARLVEIEIWTEASSIDLTTAERDFLQASRHAENAARRRARTRRRVTGSILSVAGLVVALLAVVAFAQRNQARESARVATVRELAAAATANLDIDPELSLLLALEAIEVGGDTILSEAEEALHQAMLGTRLLARIPSSVGVAHFSPDGRFFVTLGEEVSTPQVWAVDPVQPETLLVGHEDFVVDAVFSPDGNRIATTSFDGTVRVWDAATGETEIVFDVEGAEPFIPVFSRDGSKLAASSLTGTVSVWDLDTEQLIWTLPSPPEMEHSWNLEFSPDNSLLAVAYRNQPAGVPGARLWDMATGELVRILEGHRDPVSDVGFSPDGSLIVTSSFDSTVKIWDPKTGETLRTFFGHEGPLVDLQVSADGTRVASAGAVDALVWDLTTLEILATARGHKGVVDGIDLSPEGELLLTASTDDQTALLWNLSPSWSHELLAVPGAAEGLLGAVAFSPDGRTLAASRGEGQVTIWSVSSGDEVQTLDGPGPARPVRTVPNSVISLAYDPDGSLLAAMGREGVKVWDVVTGEEVTAPFSGPQGVNGKVAFAPSGDTLASASLERGVELWPLPHGETRQLAANPSFAASFSPDGSMIAIALESDDPLSFPVEIRDAEDNRLLATLDEHNRGVFGLAFNADGTFLVTASEDTTAVIWNTVTFEWTHRLKGHSGPVRNAAFHPTRPEVATASTDGTVKIWDLETGTNRLTLHGVRGFSDLAYSPDGDYLAAINRDGTVVVYILDIDELVEVARQRLTRWWTVAECIQYLHVEECPSPPAG